MRMTHRRRWLSKGAVGRFKTVYTCHRPIKLLVVPRRIPLTGKGAFSPRLETVEPLSETPTGVSVVCRLRCRLSTQMTWFLRDKVGFT